MILETSFFFVVHLQVPDDSHITWLDQGSNIGREKDNGAGYLQNFIDRLVYCKSNKVIFLAISLSKSTSQL